MLVLFSGLVTSVAAEKSQPIALTSGEQRSHSLLLAKGEYSAGQITSEAPLANAVLLSPSGEPFKQLILQPERSVHYQLVAEQAGEYQLLIEAGAATEYQLIKLDPNQAIAAAKLQSPRLQRLAEQLAMGGDSLAFWREVEQQGAPLVEDLPDKPGSKLVSFLWRGKNQQVRLFSSLPGERHPYLTRLANSDVWYRSFVMPSDSRFSYRLVPDPPQLPDPEGKNRIAILANAQQDPLNPNAWRYSDLQDRFSTDSTLELELAKHSPWLAEREVAKGELSDHWVTSELLGNRRQITLYRPAQTQLQGRQLPVLMFFDSAAYRSKVPTPKVLDNLISAGKIPPSVAVFIANPSRQSRATELPCNAKFSRFLADELLPWVESHTGVVAVPEKTLLGGSSYGGLASACTAFWHPQRFGKVLSLSGSFWWGPEFRRGANFAPEWLAGQVAHAERKAVDFLLTAGRFEICWQPSDILPSTSNRKHL